MTNLSINFFLRDIVLKHKITYGVRGFCENFKKYQKTKVHFFYMSENCQTNKLIPSDFLLHACVCLFL